MFTSLRRQTPHLLRLRTAPTNLTSSIASLRTLSSLSQSNSHTLLHSNAPEARSITPILQKRFFALSSFKRDNSGYAAEAVLESIDSDPQAAAYVHGHVEASDAPITRFSQLVQRGLVDARIVDTITKGMGFEVMTKVQCKTIVETVTGGDVLAQAKTGTGKTIAFLLPVLQRLLHSPKPLQVPNRSSHYGSLDIRAIIISPTRELALQIERDAQALIKNTPIIIQSAVGGTGKSFSLRKMHREGCHILIATPGRLNDLLSDGQANVTTQNLEMLVLDEADNLLDQGFSKEIDQILRQLPPRDSPTASSVAANKPESRQTLLFSATVPDKVLDMVKRTLRKGHKFLKMVEKGEAATHQRVEQRLIQCKNFENLMPAILELCKREIAAAEASFEGGGVEPKKEVLPFKTIVFFPTTRTASLAAETFRGLGSSNGGYQSNSHPLNPARIIEIHSRLSQEQRTKAASMFRREKSAILFSSDVTARGMDFPNVTHVIQVGYPMNLEQYIHRLGRTARGDKTGVGYLLLTDVEHNIAMRELGKMPFLKDDSISTANIDMAAEQSLPKSTAEILMSITEASLKVDPRNKAKAYMALLGYYAQVKNRQHLVDCVNRWSRVGFGMETPPSIPKMLVGKMGLAGVQGINVATGNDYAGDDRPSRSFNNRPSRSSGFGSTGGFRPPRRDFGDRPPRRGFSSGVERPPVDDLSGDESPKIEELDEDSVSEPESDGDRPPKSDFGGDRPPRRDFNNGGYSDRPARRDFNSGGYGDRPPRRDFGDRPPRGDFGGDRPPRRDFNGGGYGDRPPRRDFGAGGDRPPRRDFGAGGSYGDRPPRRDFGDRPPRNDFGGDRPPRRDFGAGGSYERPPRRDFGDRPPRNDFGGDRPPRRDFGAGGDRPPRRDFGDRPPRGDYPPKRDGRDYNAKPGGAFSGGKSKSPWQMRGKVNK